MKTLTVKDAKYFLGRLIDLARAFGGSGAMIASASCRLEASIMSNSFASKISLNRIKMIQR
jgi:hypothetical protein